MARVVVLDLPKGKKADHACPHGSPRVGERMFPVYLSGTDFIKGLAEQDGFSAKMVFNDKGAVLFPSSQQHRDNKGPGISYEDDYKGNALAAMLSPGKIEIRYHKGFSDERVTNALRDLLGTPELAWMRGWSVTYQGRVLSV